MNDDGVATPQTSISASDQLWAKCGQAGFNPNADMINDCTVNAFDPTSWLAESDDRSDAAPVSQAQHSRSIRSTAPCTSRGGNSPTAPR